MPLTHKIKITIEQYNTLKGSIDANQYQWDAEEKMFVKTLRTIKGIAELKRTSKKYGLGTKLGRTSGILYLTDDCEFSEDKTKAKIFYRGFDSPEVQISKHKLITGMNLYEVNI